MSKRHKGQLSVVLICASLMLAGDSIAENKSGQWTRWGGPTQDFQATSTGLAKSWPDEFSEDQQRLFVDLLAYSVSLSPDEKERILGAAHQLTHFQATELTRILIEERRWYLGLAANHYWQILGLCGAHSWSGV